MRTALRVPLLLVLAAGLAFTGWLLMCTTLMVHDDEGYVLIGLRDFAAGHRLYDGIFTQYGPVPFLYHDLLHRVTGWPVDHWLGRSATLAHWLVAALACGALAWRLSGRYWTAPVAMLAAFGSLWQMTWEPAHPGGLIAALAAAGLVGAVECWSRGKPPATLAVLGLTGAALFFTKINVGIFWLVAAGAWLLIRLGPRGAALAAAGLAILPFLLMRPQLGDARVLTFAVFSAVVGVALTALIAADRPTPSTTREWGAAAAGLLGLALVIIGATLAHGTTPTGLLHGVLLDPLQHPLHFQLPFSWPATVWPVAIASTGLVLAWRLLPRQRPWLADLVAGLRLLAFAGFAWNAMGWVAENNPGALLRHAFPLLPVFIIPLGDEPGAGWHRSALGLVALVAAGQALHAYPVAGSQLAWGSFLLVPVLAAGLAGAVHHLAARWRRPWLASALIAPVLLTVLLQTWSLADRGWQRWRDNNPLALAGTGSMRPLELVRVAVRIVTANAQLHADRLYSRPGLFSFNLWSGVPTPTTRNATHWSWLLSRAEQQAIADGLRQAARPAVISNQALIDLMKNDLGIEFSGPLQEHIQADYRPLLSISGYTLLVPRGSGAAPFYIAQNFRAPAPDAPALVAVNVAGPATVARIVLRHLFQPDRIIVAWDGTNSVVERLPIDREGQVAGQKAPLRWPLRLEGLQQLRLYHRQRLPADSPQLELVFLDAEGRVVCEAGYDPAANVSLPPGGG